MKNHHLVVALFLTGLLVPSIALTQSFRLSLPVSFSNVQGMDGVSYEKYADNRDGSAPMIEDLLFTGEQQITNGSMGTNGPVFEAENTFFPYIQNEDSGYLAIHPLESSGASVSVRLPETGSYCIRGAFARANDARAAGDGVATAIFRGTDAQNPIHVGMIGSDFEVDMNSPFEGEGVDRFNIVGEFSGDEIVRFTVFAGVLGSEDISFDLTALRLTITGPGCDVRNRIDLPQGFASVQGDRGIFYEGYADNRGEASSNIESLVFVGSQELANGSIGTSGPLFESAGELFPYVQNEDSGYLALHPAETRAASVSYRIPAGGTYCVEGAFARANDAQLAGDGVATLVFRQEDVENPLHIGAIGADFTVDMTKPFSGEGVDRFNFSGDFAQGEFIRFAVFSGEVSSADISFDVTALRFRVSGADCVFETRFE